MFVPFVKVVVNYLIISSNKWIRLVQYFVLLCALVLMTASSKFLLIKSKSNVWHAAMQLQEKMCSGI
jgi:hypothetical protein